MKSPNIPLLFAASFLAACQVQPDIQQIKDQNRQLSSDLQQAHANIAQMKEQELHLREELAELNRVNDVLGVEKMSRIEESSVLRSQVRRFVQSQIDAYKDFMVQGGLLDYVGGELVERSTLDEQPLLLVDLANPIPASGTLTGVGGYFARPGTFSVKVLRPVDDELVVIWDSNPLQVFQTGINQLNFTVSVVVEAGDVIAYHFAEGVMASFDEGTGDTRFQTEAVKLGELLKPASLSGEKRKRAYSLGVYGLLN